LASIGKQFHDVGKTETADRQPQMPEGSAATYGEFPVFGIDDR
jgi:hypothetical protein